MLDPSIYEHILPRASKQSQQLAVLYLYVKFPFCNYSQETSFRGSQVSLPLINRYLAVSWPLYPIELTYEITKNTKKIRFIPRNLFYFIFYFYNSINFHIIFKLYLELFKKNKEI